MSLIEWQHQAQNSDQVSWLNLQHTCFYYFYKKTKKNLTVWNLLAYFKHYDIWTIDWENGNNYYINIIN